MVPDVKFTEYFEYLNDVQLVGKKVCPYKTAEEFADPDNIFQVL